MSSHGAIWARGERRRNVVERIGATLLHTAELLGRDAIILFRSFACFRCIGHKFREIVRQMYLCGIMSFPVVVLVAIFAGAVLGLQSGYTLRKFGMEAKIGSIVAVAMCAEMGPIMTALILAGRVGSAMAAELGTMRVSEEIDALEAMSIDPVDFLVMPRVVAMVIMAPVLTVFSNLIGILGGAVVGRYQVGVSYESYFDEANTVVLLDINSGLIKAVVFGALIAVVGCSRGLQAQSSAEGVGSATKEAVVVSFTLILVFNYLITSLTQHFY